MTQELQRNRFRALWKHCRFVRVNKPPANRIGEHNSPQSIMQGIKLHRHPLFLALLTGTLSLAVWGVLAIGANFGVHSALAIAGLIWLATLGLPTSMGVAIAASVWGRIEPFDGLPGFIVLASVLGLTFQTVTFVLLWRKAANARAQGRPWRIRRGLCAFGAGAFFVAATLWATHRPTASPDAVIDGHAHLFGDEGWPPVHKKTSGLSPSQKANPTYGLLNRLLRLPATGDLNKLYLQELVRQAREAREVSRSFRVVLLAQDCRYTGTGDPDWSQTSVYVPNEHLFRVVDRHPELFIPCPSINPQRKDWEAELDYCLAQGARMLKIHPPTQAVNPGEPQFRAFYRKCAERGMRVMVHTGAEHSAPVANNTLGDPRLLDLALAEGCTVIAAHAGTKAFFDPPAEDHFQVLVEMMARQPRLYADTAVLGSQFRWRCIPEIVRTPDVLPRMLYASDWPFPSNAMVFWHRLHPFTVVELMAEKNLFVRDLRLKQALGLPPEAFGRFGNLLPVAEATGGRHDLATIE